jgi:hypothetical protein
MENLGIYILHKNSINNLTNEIYSEYISFGYESKDIFKIDIDFILLAYNIHITQNKKIRSNQDKFRDSLIKRDKSCIVSSNDFEECDACHIIPFSESNNFDIDNGILLDKSLHSSFDKNYWCIHPITLKVILNKLKIGKRNFSCVKYSNISVNIQLNEKMLKNLQKRYNIFQDYI